MEAAMTEREFFFERREAESGAFFRALDALPKDHFDYRLPDRSPSTCELVWSLVSETRACCDPADAGASPRPFRKIRWHLFVDAIHHRGNFSYVI